MIPTVWYEPGTWGELSDKYSFKDEKCCVFDVDQQKMHWCKSLDSNTCQRCKGLYESQCERLLASWGVSHIIGHCDYTYQFAIWKAIVFGEAWHKIGRLTDEQFSDYKRIIVAIVGPDRTTEDEKERQSKEKRQVELLDIIRNL